MLLPVVLALTTVAGCAKPPPTSPPPPVIPGPGGEVKLELTVENTKFDLSSLTVPAGANVTLVFTSKEPPLDYHNVAIFKDRTAREAIFVGEYIDGGESITYNFTAPGTPGTYFLRCDTHPFLMNVQFIVQ